MNAERLDTKDCKFKVNISQIKKRENVCMQSITNINKTEIACIRLETENNYRKRSRGNLFFYLFLFDFGLQHIALYYHGIHQLD